jgi:hypothetical protein
MAYPPTMRIQKGNHKKRIGSNYKDLESEKMGGTSKSRLHEMLTDHTLKYLGLSY